MNDLKPNQTELIEIKMDQLAIGALYLQGGLLFILFLILILDFPHYKDAAKALSIGALLASFIISRIYIREGKKLEEIKVFSQEEAEERKREYATKFFSPYILWIGCFVIFSL